VNQNELQLTWKSLKTPDVAITDAIASHAKWRTDRTALVCGDLRVTWRDFNQAINRVANGLMKGALRKGGQGQRSDA